MRKFSSAVRAALKGHDPSTEQEAAITHDPVPLAIIAGAGSGKTAVMAARIVWMTEEGIADPAQILGLTFSNKAAGELEARIGEAFAQMDPVPVDLPGVMTYNSFADRLVREHGVRIGIDPEVGLLSEGQSWQLILKALEDVGPFEAIDSRSARSLCRDGLSLAEQCDNQLLTPEAVAEEDERIIEEADYFGEEALLASRKRRELANLVRAYINRKRRAQRIDFGDQVAKAVQILQDFPEVAAQLRQRFRAVLLDEYQDTNVAQRKLLEALVLEPGSGAGNVTAVGDARQNIFQWRGSTLFNLIDFPKHFPRADGEHDFLSLSENFRSGSKILEVANEVIDPVPADRRPGLPLKPFAGNGRGFVGVKLLADQRREAAFIAHEIRRLRDAGQEPGGALSWSDFAILVRRRKHIGPIFEALRDADIPVEVVGLGGLLEVPEIVDVTAWLRVIAEPGPSGNRWLARILFGPRFRIHFRDLALLARWAEASTKELAKQKEQQARSASAGREGVVLDTTKLEPDEVAFSLTEALDHIGEISELPAEAAGRLGEAAALIHRLRGEAHVPLADLVQRVIDQSGLGDAVLASARTDAPAAMGNLRQFLSLVDGFSPLSGEATLTEFLGYLDAAEEADDSLELEAGRGGDSVKLMTVHNAKGLEFHCVFVPGVAARENDKGEKVDSVFPDTRTTNPFAAPAQLPYAARADAEHLPAPWQTGRDGKRVLKKAAKFKAELKDRAVEDERRLFYVALTRAKQRLYVTAAWWYERNLECRGPSAFFEEVRGSAVAEDLGQEPMPESSPMMAELSSRAVWPPDPPNNLKLFEELGSTYPDALEAILSGRLSNDDLFANLGEASRREAEEHLARHRSSMASLSRPQEPAPGASGPGALGQGISSLSATVAVALTSGRMTPGNLRVPLPRRPSSARSIGTQVHSWIEEQARGLTGLADEDALDEPLGHMAVSRVGTLRQNFRNMGYTGRRLARLEGGEPMAEVPFVLKLGSRLVRGRIDAVYEAEDEGAGLEIVDFKTGAEVESPDIDQLLVYAGALAKLGLDLDRPLKLTLCYLDSGQNRSRSIDGKTALEAVQQLERRLSVLDV